MSRLLLRWMEVTERWSLPFAVLASGLAFGFATAVDYAVGRHLGVGFLYLFACAFAVWCLGEKAGFGVAVLGALAAAGVRHVQLPLLLGHPAGIATELLNLAARLLSFALLAIFVHRLGCVLALERWRASHDELTGALNKAGFQRAMLEGIRHARTQGGTLLLAYMDLDGFKAVNDRHGHSAGDHVLRSFAVAAAGAIRPSDLFARIGGDEFAALLMLPAAADGHSVAELLHRRLTVMLGQSGFAVTCSMGAVFITGEEAAVGLAIVEQADALMYEVKRAGKDALRVSHGNAAGKALRSAPRAPRDDELDGLLVRTDPSDRREAWLGRRAA